MNLLFSLFIPERTIETKTPVSMNQHMYSDGQASPHNVLFERICISTSQIPPQRTSSSSEDDNSSSFVLISLYSLDSF